MIGTARLFEILIGYCGMSIGGRIAGARDQEKQDKREGEFRFHFLPAEKNKGKMLELNNPSRLFP